MRILGIDPGLKATGYGLIDVTRGKVSLLEAGVIEPKRRKKLQHRIQTIYNHLSEIINQYHPEVMVLEKLYTHNQRLVVACIMGHARGVICLLSAQNGIALAEYSVKRIRKALTGVGSATKSQTQHMVAHLLRIPEDQLTPDASDALALALGYIQITKGVL